LVTGTHNSFGKGVFPGSVADQQNIHFRFSLWIVRLLNRAGAFFPPKPETRGAAEEGDTRNTGFGDPSESLERGGGKSKGAEKRRILHIEKGKRSQINWCSKFSKPGRVCEIPLRDFPDLVHVA
jgi:hypothetical protein